MEYFDEDEANHQPYYTWTCKACFLEVVRSNREKHAQWHEDLARVAKEAGHAYMWTSVIG